MFAWNSQGTELKRFAKHPMTRAAMAVMLLIPLLYGAMYVWAFWSPTDRLNELPVALVNADQGATLDGKSLQAGKEVVDELERRRPLGWEQVSAEEAAQGVADGRYYFAVTIPEDFSADVASLGGEAPQQAHIDVTYDDANSFLASTLGRSAMTQVRDAVAATTSQQAVDSMLIGLGDLRDGMGEASDGAFKLRDGLTTARDGGRTLNLAAVALNDGATRLDKGAQQLATGTDALATGASKLSTGADSLHTGASKVATGANQLSQGTKTLVTSTKPLATGATTLAEGSQQLSTGLSTLDDKMPDLTKGVDSLDTGATILARGAKAVDDGLGSYETGVTTASSGAARLATGTSTLNKNFSTLSTGATDYAKGATDYAAGATSYGKGASSFSTGASTYAAGAKRWVDGAGDGTTQLAAGVKQLHDAAASAAASDDPAMMKKALLGIAAKTDAGTQTTRPTLADGVAALHKEVVPGGKLYAGVYSVDPSAPGLSAGAAALSQASPKLTSGASDLTTAAGKLTAGAKQMSGAKPQIDALAQGAQKLSDAFSQTTPTPGLVAGATALHKGAHQVALGAGSLSGGLDKLDSSTADLSKGVAKLDSGASRLNTGMTSLKNKVPSLVAGANKLNSGAQQLATGTKQVSDGSGTLAKGASDVSDGATKASDGASTLADGTSTLADGTSKLKKNTPSMVSGLDKMRSGAQTLGSSLRKGEDQIPHDSVEVRTQRSEAVASPVDLQQTTHNLAESWGEGFAPFFMSLALWVGALITWLLLRPLQTRALMTPVNGLRTAWGSLSSALVLALGQGLIMLTVMHFAVGLNPAHVAGTIAFTTLVAFAFMALQQFFQVAFGTAVGKVIAISILMVQLASSGGTYPIETEPGFLRAINPYMPMTYSVTGFRQVISGGIDSRLWLAVGVLVGTFVLSVLGSAVMAARKKTWSVSRLHPAISL